VCCGWQRQDRLRKQIVSEPDALIAWLRGHELELTRIGLAAGPLSQWLYAAMRQAGLAVELLETRHVRNALKTMPVKTDRNARGRPSQEGRRSINPALSTLP
jgi:transposase